MRSPIHGPRHALVDSDRTYMHEASLDLEHTIGIPCVTQVFNTLKIALMQAIPALEIEQNNG